MLPLIYEPWAGVEEKDQTPNRFVFSLLFFYPPPSTNKKNQRGGWGGPREIPRLLISIDKRNWVFLLVFLLGCYRVLPSLFSEFHFVTGFYLAFTDHNTNYWVLLGFTGLYRVWLGFTKIYRVLVGFTKFLRVLLGFTGFYRVFIQFYWVLLGLTGFFLVL